MITINTALDCCHQLFVSGNEEKLQSLVNAALACDLIARRLEQGGNVSNGR